MRVVVFFLTTIFCSMSFAKNISYGSREVTIKIGYKAEGVGASRSTFLRFPKRVYRVDGATKFKIGPAKVKSGKSDYRELAVIPLYNSGEQKVEFTLSDRTVIKAILVVVDSKNASFSYDLRPKRIPSKRRKAAGGSNKGELGVMSLLRSGAVSSLMKSSYQKKKIHCYGNNLYAYVRKKYSGSGHKAFVISIKNWSSSRTYRILPHEISLKKRDITKPFLKSVIPEVLKPGERATVTLLADSSMSLFGLGLCDSGKQVITENIKVAKRRKSGKRKK